MQLTCEGKELLKDKAEIIKTKGKPVVSNDLEAEFDFNNDGIIDRSEAPPFGKPERIDFSRLWFFMPAV